MEPRLVGLVITLMSCLEVQTDKKVKPIDLCEGMECRHDSPCRTTLIRTGSQETLTAQCDCHGIWVGPRCEAEIRLASRIISSTTIEVIVELHISGSLQSSKFDNKSGFIQNFLRYSLQYWKNGTRDSCSIIPRLTTTKYVVNNLIPDTRYYFCVEPNSNDLCFPLRTSSDITSLPRNCLSVHTRDVPVYTNAPSHLVPVTLTIVILLAAVILSIPFLRKYSSCQCIRCRGISSKVRRRLDEDEDCGNQELLLLGPSLSSNLPNINAPSSPGRPKHKLNRRSTGYVSFATKNAKRIELTTVVEYVPDDEYDTDKHDQYSTKHGE